MGGSRNRTKGHDLERFVATLWRSLGFEHCITTRNGSKKLDDCGIDLMFIPFNIQCKSGYEKRRPKYDVEYSNTRGKLEESFPPEELVHKKPYVLVHRLDGYGIKHPEKLTWTFDHSTIVDLLSDYYRLKKLEEHGELHQGEDDNL